MEKRPAPPKREARITDAFYRKMIRNPHRKIPFALV